VKKVILTWKEEFEINFYGFPLPLNFNRLCTVTLFDSSQTIQYHISDEHTDHINRLNRN